MAELLHRSDWLTHLVDIALVAFLVYRLVIHLKETTAIRLLLTLPIVLIAYLLAQLSDLRAFQWLLDNFLGSLVVILVVIFQYDIRRAFLSFSRNHLVKRWEPDEDESHAVIEELLAAVEGMAGKRIGALIVVEREVALDNLIAIGTEIDAKVTSELISSIFLPYSPIHDGAVIIQHGKLTKAGCFLPLTQNPEVAKELGTRHRAAIGLTELCDAVVIVVSEESGGVSVVVSGRITRDLDLQALRKVLKRLIESRWLQ
ncbi:diadenylate cyclase CdaA [Geobacter argillaceus]|uniref:Diadenylate cyclase n=1 Tax=Geobacter argillaceus TaxID=345631 RepID=A0A562W8S2_9BACT|nr:diadenylate cyclase CdaA [Geobacter argillaceus]TWJ26498.1 uncharacterized protein (TIGR00159 family) [Geobacter argillaceus]